MDLLTNGFNLVHKLFENLSSKTILEFGVGSGNSFIWMLKQIEINNFDTKLIGFDSWLGLPKETSGIWYPDRHAEGNYAFNKNIVLNSIKNYELDKKNNYYFVDGFYENSLTKEVQSKISNVILINIDVDIYKSSMEVLNFIEPFLTKDVILYWDDWKDPADQFPGKWGEHLAWEEWSNLHPEIKWEFLEINEYNQRTIIIK